MSTTRDALLAKLKDLSPEQRDALLKKIQQQKQASGKTEALAIPVLERHKQGYELSFAQQRLWFLEKLYPESAAYHIAVAIELQGDLSISLLEQSFLQLIQRHESLRTCFVESDNSVKQHLITVNQWQLEAQTITGDIQAQLEADAKQSFDLSQAPLIRTQLYKISEQQHVLSVVMHHIIADGWSSQILLHELSATYNALKQGTSAELPELSSQYIDYSAWQAEQLASNNYQQQLEFWLEQLQSVENLQLGSDKARPAVLSQNGASEVLLLSREKTQALSELCQQQKTSLFVGLLAIFETLLYRYSQQTDFAIGTPIAGRNHPETQAQLGLFVNTQALPCRIIEGENFVQLLERIRQQSFDLQSKQDIPFEQVIDRLQLARDGSYSPIFQAFFSFQPGSLEQAISLDGLNCRFIDIETHTAKFELSLIIREQENGLRCHFEYNSDIYTAAAIQQLAQHFSYLISAVSQTPETPLNALAFLSSSEENQLIKTQHPRDYPVHHIADLFAEQVAKHPEKIAVVQGDTQLSFSELEQKSNQVAAYLIEQGVQANDFVGLCFAPCWELPIALLAAIKIGACYVPIDPNYPAQRIAYMLDSLQIKTVLSCQRFSQSLPENAIDIHSIQNSSAGLPAIQRDSEQLLYVIFTSGSTGTPKAAAVRHRNASNLLHWYSEHYQLSEQDKLLLFSAIGFDLSQKNLLAPLCFGAELHFSASEYYDPEALLNTIAEQGITWTNCAPSAFYPLANSENHHKLASLKKLFFGGETIRLDNLQPWFSQSDCQISNMYGPTECTDIATSFSFDKNTTEQPLPIGEPAANVDCYVLDKHKNLLPKGAIGELYISGLGVGAGYLNDEALNQQSFIANPFKPNELMYKTGDLVRYNESNQLVFIGRADQQLKIRGFRIELGEIEAQLRLIEGVKNAVVAVQEIQNQPQLCAFIISDKTLLSRENYRKALQQHLPDYMVPITFQAIDSIPLSPNGKVDRKQLPQLSSSDITSQQEYIAPRNANEQALADILQTVLQLPKIGVLDNFFELGGNSLSATQVISRIKQHFELDLPLRTLFETPTIDALAAVITALSQVQNNDYDDDDFEEGFL